MMPQKCPSNYVVSFLFQAPPSNIVLLFPPCLPTLPYQPLIHLLQFALHHQPHYFTLHSITFHFAPWSFTKIYCRDGFFWKQHQCQNGNLSHNKEI